MRRKDREITDFVEIEAIIRKALVCHVALSDNNVPYIVAMNFGYKAAKKPILYFHCAHEGKKMEILQRNSLACFQVDIDHELMIRGTWCGCSMKYRSVVGMGRVSVVEDKNEKIEALTIIMDRYVGGSKFSFEERNIERTRVLKLEIDELTGKERR